MPRDCSIAIKEWAVVCAALAQGRQSILLRKGGIDEGADGFRPKHARFWLLPTEFHQSGASLRPDALDLLAGLEAPRPVDGELQIDHLAEVSAVFHVDNASALDGLASLHVWSAETVRQRFHYRRPGLVVMLVRIYKAPQSSRIRPWPELAGCHSWVELPRPLSTAEVQPVLPADAWQRVADQVHARLVDSLAPSPPSD